MNRDAFEALKAQGYRRIPVYRKVLADLDTPLSVYLKLADGPDAYLLESVEGGETWGRFSIIGLPAETRYVLEGNEVATYHEGAEVARETVADPLDFIARLQQTFNAARIDELPVFTGGLVGYFGYEIVQNFEARLRDDSKPDQLGTPEMVLLQSEEVAVFDNLAGRLYLIVNVDPAAPEAWEHAQRRLDRLTYRLRCGSPGYGEAAVAHTPVTEENFSYGFSRGDFIRAVEKS